MGLSLLKAKLTHVPGELIVHQVMTDVEQIMIRADPPRLSAPCSVCHQRSHRIHSRYIRTLAGLPSQGQAVTIALSVRRFRCDNTACTRVLSPIENSTQSHQLAPRLKQSRNGTI
jgi:transposase